MPSSARVDRRIWWMSTDERDKLLASWRDSVTVSRAVSVECAALKPD